MALKPGQEKCINTLDRSLVVAAGAGSGKTFTLTKRIVHAIEVGAVDDIDRICAITFTNKAAGELKARIKTELRACGRGDQALKVDEAWVSTIHGMCARILRAHAVELGLDPSFAMADETLVGELRDRAIDEVLTLSGGGGEPAALQADVDALFAEYPARSYGAKGNSVESMLRRLMGVAGSNVAGFDAFVMPDSRVNPAALVDAVLDAFEALAEATRAQKPSEARLEWIANAEQAIEEARVQMGENASDPAWALKAIDSLPKPKRVGTADFKSQVSEALGLLGMCAMELRLAASARHLRTLVALARQAQGRYVAAKRQAGVLDNDDLLVLASRAITENPEIAAQYADRFQLVMVDEFQDTDQMQVDMIKKLAGPGARRLCTVGDAQQSIYRFRGADVSVYRKHLGEVRAGNPDDVIELPDNFRSHRDVLSLVDRVFERPDMFGGEFMSLKPGRDESRVKKPFAPGSPRIQVQLTTNAYRGAPSDQVRATAAARIAQSFAQLRDEGHSAGEMAVLLGSMSYADVYADALRAQGLACVISGGSVFSRTAEAGIVCDLVRVAANPYQTQALLNVLTSPMFALSAGDLLELATEEREGGKLRRRNLWDGVRVLYRAQCEGDSPCADGDGAAGDGAAGAVGEMGAAGAAVGDAGAASAAAPDGACSGDAAPAGDATSGKLSLAVRVIGAMLEGVSSGRVSKAVMRAVRDSGWLSRLQQLGAEGLASAANVYKAVRMVSSIEAAGTSGPALVASSFAATLAQSKEAPGALSSAGSDFVRIMTVHASKGLEFPITAVAEFKDPSGDSSRLLATELGGKVYLSLDLQNSVSALSGCAASCDLPGLYASLTEGLAGEDELAAAAERASGALQLRSILYEYDRIGDEEEAKRLLYVALTRAKEALVVSMKGKRTKDNPSGIPKNCLGQVVVALAGEESGFDEGTSLLDFGGTAPAFVEHVALQADEEQGEESTPGTAELDRFAIPLLSRDVEPARRPFSLSHEGVFSYSSVADASHEGDLLGRLAQAFAAGVDGALADDGAEGQAADGAAEGGAHAAGCGADGREGFGAAVGGTGAGGSAQSRPEASGVYADDGSVGGMLDGEYGSALGSEAHPAVAGFQPGYGTGDDDAAFFGGGSSDADKATDLGTAFHRLAQYAVVTRGQDGRLCMPPQDRIEALSRAGMLDEVLRARLRTALDRWFASEVADRMGSLPDVRAEVPFFVNVPQPATGAPVFLEGEIDLLALDGPHAYVVDYKTGGRQDETRRQLTRKHVLQASCYAYAILLQGFESVDATFVRVEQGRLEDPAQPQCVRYHFKASDVAALQRAIAEAYALAAADR